MREETTAVVLKNINLPEDKQTPMTEKQKQILKDVRTCLEIMDGNLMMPTVNVRDKLMEATQCKRDYAYKIILIARQALGNRKPTSKLAIREEVLEMMRVEYQEAIKLTGADRVDAVTKIAKTIVKTFHLDDEDSAVVDIAQMLEDSDRYLTIDPTAIGITLTDKQRRDIARLKRKYMKDILEVDVEDVEAQPVEEENHE